MVRVPAKQLVIRQPVGCQLIIHQPVLSQPGTSQQSMNEPGTSQLDTSMNRLDINPPSTSLPDMNQLGINPPVVSQPVMSEPAMSEPAMSEAELSEPEMSQPGPTQPSVKQLFISKLYRSQCSASQAGLKPPDANKPGTSQVQLGWSQAIWSEPGRKQPGPSQSRMNQLQPGWSPSLRCEPGVKQPGPSKSGLNPPQLGRGQPTPSEPGMKRPGPSQSGLSEPVLKQQNPTSPRQSYRKQPSGNFFQIRAAEARDCIRILHLIQESAAFENMSNVVKLTARDLFRDGFGDNPLFYCQIAEVFNQKTAPGKATAGFAMYNFTYDAWIGKLLYIEDFYVTQPYRGLGIGAAMLKRLSQIAIRSECNCMHFHAVICSEASMDYDTGPGTGDLFSRESRYLFRINKEKLLYMAGEL